MRARRGTWGRRVAAMVIACGAVVAEAPRHGVTAASPAVTVHLELIEQPACLAEPDGYRLGFDVRTIYVNEGPTPVAIAAEAGRIVAVTFDDEGEAETAAFAVPPGLLASTPPAGAHQVTMAPGWAVSERTAVWVPLSDGSGLEPGTYRVRFDVRVPLAGAMTTLSTPAMAVRIDEPGPVQECGSFTLPLPPASPVPRG